MQTIDDLKCKHGKIINCKECDQEFYDAMYKAGREAAKRQDEQIMRSILGSRLISDRLKILSG